MPTVFWIWMTAAAIFLIIELLTPTLVFICFVAGALGAGVYSGFSPEQYLWQIGTFIVVSLVLLPFTRRFADRISKAPPELSNVDRMIGQTAIVTRDIDPDTGGQVKFEGELWQARADAAIAKDARVQIVSVSGTKVFVQPIS